MFRKKKKSELELNVETQKNDIKWLIAIIKDMQNQLKSTIQYKETAEQNVLLGRVFSNLVVKEYEKDKDKLLFIKSNDNNHYAYANFLIENFLVSDIIPNVKIVIHNGEFDNINLINTNDYINTFNTMFKGLYKIVKDENAE